MIVQWLLIGTSIRYLSESYVKTRLEHDAQSLLAAMDFNTDPALPKTALVDTIYKQPFSGHYYTIQTAQRKFRSRSLWDTDLPIAPLEHGQSRMLRASGPQDQILLIFQTAYKRGNDLILMSVAEDLTPILTNIANFRLRHTGISIAILALLVVLQGYIIKRNLKPLDSVRRQVENLEKGVIQQLNENVPREIYPLVRELNQQLVAIKKRLERSRNATGNLAHALKTPLTLIAQLAESEELKKFPEVRKQLLNYSETIRRNIERELKRARMAGGNVTGRQIRLLPQVNDLLATLSAMYQQKSLDVTVNISPAVQCSLERQDLLEILGNILDNAFKWAEHSVRISAQQDQQTRLIVEDDGPGHDPQETEKLVNRGARADEKIPGHGLGLSIVAEILAEYRGELTFERSPDLGGMRVCVCFPNTG
jgi:signal transduction histidine kinase